MWGTNLDYFLTAQHRVSTSCGFDIFTQALGSFEKATEAHA